MKICRSGYQSLIWEYKRRRNLYKENYKGELPIYKTERYIQLTMKISQWRKEIKRLDKRKRKIAYLLNSVNKYFSVRIQDRVRNEAHDLARKIYFKVGLESKICGTHLSRFIGRKHYDVAALNRRSLIKSFAVKPGNKQAYHNFKKYFEN